MQTTVQGKQIDVGAALRTHVTDKIGEMNEKYFNHATSAGVTFSREGHGHGLIRAHISIRIGKDIMVMADATENDPYLAFEVASEKVAKQMRRYKRRLREHHRRLESAPKQDMLKARDYTLADNDEEKDSMPKGKDPVIIAEITTDIQTMSVSEAVMRMDLAGQTAMLFRNAKHNELNMVYRRPDGNVGWIDPAGNQKARMKPALKAPPKSSAKSPSKPVSKAKAKPAIKTVAKKKRKTA